MSVTGAIIGSALIGGAGSIIGNLIGSSSAREQSELEMAFNSTQAQLNRNFQKSERLSTQNYNTTMWNLNNQYNERMLAQQREYDSPEAQLERAMAAGINPNAVVGGLGNGSANFTPAYPVSSTPSNGSSASYSSGLPSALVGSQAQYLSAISDAVAKFAQAKESDAKADNIRTDTAWDKSSFEERLRAVKANTDRVLRETKNIDFTEEQTRKVNEWVASHTDAQIKEINKKLIFLDNQIALEAEKIITEQKNQNLIDSQIDLNESDESYKEIQTKVYEEIYKQEQVKTAFATATEIPVGSSEWQAMYYLWKNKKFMDVAQVALYTSDNDLHRTALIAGKNARHWYEEGKNFLSVINPFGSSSQDPSTPVDIKSYRGKDGKMYYEYFYADGTRETLTNDDVKKRWKLK